jgi:hypothetical protein
MVDDMGSAKEEISRELDAEQLRGLALPLCAGDVL